MKSRIATILTAMFMFLGGTAFALNPVNQKTDASKTVAKILQQEIEYPKSAKEDNFECFVLVKIIIEEDGTLTVNCINCTCPTMKAEVVSAIENINSKKLVDYAGQQFNYKLNFKLI